MGGNASGTEVRVPNDALTSEVTVSITEHLVPAHPKLLSVDEAASLGQDTVAEIYRQHISPGQWTAFALLGFDRITIDHAEDVYYVDRSGRRILDFFGGFGAMALGHNHPRVLAVRRRFQEQQRHELALTLPSQYVAALSRNLATLAPEGLDRVMLYCSGSEAVEAALKLAERAQGPRRAKVAYARNSFHGKTIGALSVTDSEFYRGRFEVLPRRQAVPFGDAAALEELLRRERGIGVLILETVQGGAGVVLPPPGYLEQVRRLCDRYGVLWIADEVQCGVGRTGRFFAFEHAGVTPDIVTLAKALGGGKTAISAVLAGHEIHDRAYGGARNARPSTHRDDRGTAALRELDGGESDSARGTCDEHPLRPDPGAVQHVLRSRVGARYSRELLVAPVTTNGMRLLRGRDRELREPAVAFAAEGPALERPVADRRAQHVPHEDAFADAIARDPLAHIDDATADVGTLDARELESGTRPSGIDVVDGVEPARAALTGLSGDGPRIPPDPGVHVGVVDPGGGDLDQHLPALRVRNPHVGPVLEFVQSAMPGEQDGGHRRWQQEFGSLRRFSAAVDQTSALAACCEASSGRPRSAEAGWSGRVRFRPAPNSFSRRVTALRS